MMAHLSSGPSRPGASLRPIDDQKSTKMSSDQSHTASSPSTSSHGTDDPKITMSKEVTLTKSHPTAFRSSSIFRLGRRSFGRKKDKAAAPSVEMTASLESQRSRASLGSSTSQSSSPVLYRDAPSMPMVVRNSISSTRGGDSISDGKRASSDLDSPIAHGKMVWSLNRSSISLRGDSIAEGVEPSYTDHSEGRLSLASSGGWVVGDRPSSSAETRPPLVNRFQAQRSFSSSSVPQWSEAGEHARAAGRFSSSSSSPSSPRSTRKISALASSASASRSPQKRLPPTPRITSGHAGTRNHYEAQRVSRNAPLIRAEEVAHQHRPDSATFKPFKVKKRTMATSMIDDEMNSSPRRAEQLDLQQFLESGGEDSDRRPSQQNSLDVPDSTTTSRGLLRKTRSQSSFILARRPSFLGGSKKGTSDQAEARQQQRVTSTPQNGKTDDAIAQSPGRMRPTTSEGVGSSSPIRRSPTNSRSNKGPWDKLFSSRQDMPDSSPEVDTLQPYFPSATAHRNSSASSMDKLASHSKAGLAWNGSSSAHTSRPVSPLVESRLDSRGGAANLFGTASSAPRRRASSLLPAVSWRPRTGSNAELLPSSSNTDNGTLSSSDPKSSSEKEKASPAVKVDARQFNGDVKRFVEHVLTNVPRTDYSAVLASSGDEIHKQALHYFMQQFYFASNPLDIALRKLLMSVCLPKETQQIDRVMEAFARRYNECNEALFSSDDQPYVLAFSLMMLHTDAFNKNAKQKMTKQDYLRNTASSGVRDEILEYLYDNLTFTQFIYVEDDEKTMPRKKTDNEAANSGSFLSAFSTNGSSSSKNRIDPYYIIASGQTHTLRADLAALIAEDSPFSAKGTAVTYDIEALNRSFVNAPSIEIVTTRKPSLPASGLGSDTLSTSFGAIEKEQETIVTLRVTKVGCISRKDDIVDDNKKAQSRKWKTCGMVLSSSQLLFFKDLVWTSALSQQIKEQTGRSLNQEGGVLITPRITYFRPDGVLALGDAIAVRDTSYKKYEYVIRLIARQGDQSRQYLLQTSNEAEMNDWIHKINFCAAFRASGLRIRGLDPPNSPPLDGNSAASFSYSSFASGADGEAVREKETASSPPPSPGMSFTSDGSVGSSGVPMVGLMRRKLNARRKEVLPKLALSTLKYREVCAELEEALRFARHLGILTPFMKVTRDRIEATAIPLSHRVRQLRLDVARYGSRREMLQLELDAGDRAARATAPPSSFIDVPGEGEEGGRSEASAPLVSKSTSPSPMTDISNTSLLRHQRQRDAEMDEGNLATPKVQTVAIGDDRRSNGLRPAIVMRQHSSPPASSQYYLTSDEPSLDDILGQVLDAPLFLDQQPAISSATTTSPSDSNNSKRTRSPPPRRSKHSSAPREEAERWDRSKIVRDSKRVSLVTLPDAEHLKNLARLSVSHTLNGNLEEHTE